MISNVQFTLVIAFAAIMVVLITNILHNEKAYRTCLKVKICSYLLAIACLIIYVF